VCTTLVVQTLTMQATSCADLHATAFQLWHNRCCNTIIRPGVIEKNGEFNISTHPQYGWLLLNDLVACKRIMMHMLCHFVALQALRDDAPSASATSITVGKVNMQMDRIANPVPAHAGEGLIGCMSRTLA
jgi:hypothetical protein